MSATFGAQLRALRTAAGLSQRALAARVDLDFTYLCKLERGRATPPSSAAITALARELGADADPLYAAAGKFPPDLARALLADPALLAAARALLPAPSPEV